MHVLLTAGLAQRLEHRIKALHGLADRHNGIWSSQLVITDTEQVEGPTSNSSGSSSTAVGARLLLVYKM